MAPHSSTLAWKIPWTEEPGMLQSMGSRRVGHDWATSLSLFTSMHWRRKWQPTPVFLAWRIPGTEEPAGLPSMGSHRVGHDWSDLAAAAAAQRFSLASILIGRNINYIKSQRWHNIHFRQHYFIVTLWGPLLTSSLFVFCQSKDRNTWFCKCRSFL